MTQAGLAGVSRRRFVTTTAKDGGRPAPDLVERNFTANRRISSGSPTSPTCRRWAGFLYLAVVLDAWSRGSSAGRWPHISRTQLVLDALKMAIGQRRPERRDPSLATRAANTRRWRSANAAGRQACGRRWARSATPMTTPCARASSPRSNASCSSGAGSRRRPRRACAVFAFIEGFYNPRRRHSSIGYLSPIDYERRHHALTLDPEHTSAWRRARDRQGQALRAAPRGAVLDRRCARRPHHRAGRDGRMALPGPNQRMARNRRTTCHHIR